jgi:hypothetical protein
MKIEEIDYSKISAYIPEVLQAFNGKQALNACSLEEFRDAFRVNQMQCKAWLLDNIHFVNKESKVLVIGSWLGFTSYCLYKMGFNNISETDPDDRLEVIANAINCVNENFIHLNEDVNHIDISQYDLVINTSCEHIEDNTWFSLIKPGAVVVLQSTNFKCDDHVNTVESIDEMKHLYKMKTVYEDELKLNDIFTRYMLIGIKDV